MIFDTSTILKSYGSTSYYWFIFVVVNVEGFNITFGPYSYLMHPS